MELLCRRRAALDTQHGWMWLGEAEVWRDLAHRETASRFQTTGLGPMAMGPNTIEGDYRNWIGKEPEAGLWSWNASFCIAMAIAPETFHQQQPGLLDGQVPSKHSI
jgi:hypothetical protein